jgi:hypothetical protein
MAEVKAMKWLIPFLIIGFLFSCYPLTEPQKPASIVLVIYWPYWETQEYSVGDGVWTPNREIYGEKLFWISSQNGNIGHYPPASPEWWQQTYPDI